ncbi:polyhydroxyalkanoate synthesis repressor PhaR [Altererythrobacter sp. CC-YST694]|uniref:polyhydroxyalkanoate synthesis repressor PhaR n=1 Tax=Altererythrobacter sp. CC-YST694 TaxID=2755038 RepID=UPI001D004BA4|nr:polyhydroxyalkanoate synthesis repressor PhaR [Altererythrobacter sp. CC-YST694]MCB5424503.1 polyhydroxyalkanoate synthesis repressor PhaR [Altererythrobacter sp. CC-YST694]
MAKSAGGSDQPVIIKKYANRRLYNTSSSSYITLDDLAKMTREGVEFQVLDAKTGTDITHSILTQIIMEEEASGGEQMLPISFLRQLISMYGNSMQALMPHYLEATMENFQANQRKLQDVFKQSMGGDTFAKMAETNMAMFKAAAAAFMPNASAAAEQESAPTAPQAKTEDELALLRKQMAEIQKKLDSLGS